MTARPAALHRVDPLSVPAPAEIAWLTGLIGAAAALKLIERFGGTRVFVSRAPRPGNQVTHAIGLENAVKLAAQYGDQDIKVPLAKFWRVRLYHEAGMTYAQIARRVGCGESLVHAHLQRARLTNRPPAPVQDEMKFF